MTLLTIIQSAAEAVGVPAPSAVVSTTDIQIKKLYRQAQIEGRFLSRRHNWTDLVKEQTFTSVAAELQGALSALIDDNDYRKLVNRTAWNRSQQDHLGGPLNSVDWQLLKASSISGPYYNLRIWRSNIYLQPAPTAGDTIAFEYVSKHWCQSSGGTGQAAWAADADTGILDEELMEQGVIWRFLRASGLDYAEEFRTYEYMVEDAWGSDGARRVLHADAGGDPQPAVRAPEGSWNIS
jgi:hypothetical protein